MIKLAVSVVCDYPGCSAAMECLRIRSDYDTSRPVLDAGWATAETPTEELYACPTHAAELIQFNDALRALREQEVAMLRQWRLDHPAPALPNWKGAT